MSMNKGEECICQEDDWFNAFGEQCFALHTGMRTTVTGTKYVGGLQFLMFKETPKDHWFMSAGFISIKEYN